MIILNTNEMAAYALDNHVGEQRDSGRAKDSQPFHSFLRPVAPAVRRKFVLVRLVQVTVNILKGLLRVSGIGIGQGAALGNFVNAYMTELAHFYRHCRIYLAQRVKVHDDDVQHSRWGNPLKLFTYFPSPFLRLILTILSHSSDLIS